MGPRETLCPRRLIEEGIPGNSSSGGGGGEEEEGEDGPERNSGVFPQETEPEAGCGGAGEPQHPQA